MPFVLPASPLGRLVAAWWLTSCVGMLVFAYVQQQVHDMPVAFIWLMVLISFPAGLLGAPLVGVVWSALSTFLGFTYQPFWDVLPYWVVLVVLGYWQWFVVIPELVRKVLSASSSA